MRPPSEDIANLLADAGVGAIGASTGWRIGTGQEPGYSAGSIPHTVITLYDPAGQEPDYRPGIDRPAVHVRARGSPGMPGYPGGWNKAREIRSLLLDAAPVEIGGALYSLFEVEQEPNHLEMDEGDRPIFVATYRIQREPVDDS